MIFTPKSSGHETTLGGITLGDDCMCGPHLRKFRIISTKKAFNTGFIRSKLGLTAPFSSEHQVSHLHCDRERRRGMYARVLNLSVSGGTQIDLSVAASTGRPWLDKSPLHRQGAHPPLEGAMLPRVLRSVQVLAKITITR